MCDDLLRRFLENPRITVEFVEAAEVEELRKRCSLAEAEAQRASVLYARECDFNNRLIDLLRENGIAWK